MEVKNYTQLNGNGCLQDGNMKAMQIEDKYPSVKSGPSFLALALQGLCTEVCPNPTKGNKRNSISKKERKVKCLELPKTDLNGSSSLGMRVNREAKSFDLNEEQNDDVIIISSHINRKGKKSDDLKESNVSNEQYIFMETRLDKIPKDVLGKYGFVIEDSDMCRNSPVPEEKNVWNDEVEEEGKLIIDEEECTVLNAERENSSRCEVSQNETDIPPVNLSTKENTAGFTNCGHHLVISSVTSLQWSERCTVCNIQLSPGESLEAHKEGHCLFPGCLDFIPDEAERAKHLQVHKAHPIKPFRCEYCKKRFHYYRFTKKHREICRVLKRWKCPYCNYSSPKVAQYNKHVAKHTNKLNSQITGTAKVQ